MHYCNPLRLYLWKDETTERSSGEAPGIRCKIALTSHHATDYHFDHDGRRGDSLASLQELPHKLP